MFAVGTYEKPGEKTDLARVKGLKQRFVALGETLARTKNQRSHRIDDRIQVIESALLESRDDNNFCRTTSSVDALVGKAEQISHFMTKLETDIKQVIAQNQEEMKICMGNVKKENMALIDEFNKETNDRLFSLSLALNKSQKVFSDKLDQRFKKVAFEIDNISCSLENEIALREEQTATIENKIIEDLQFIEKDLQVEVRLRHETNHKLKSLVDEVTSELDKLMEREREERESVNNSLLGLLEESCYKIERNFSCSD